MFNLSAVLNLTGVNTASVDSTMNQLNSRMRTTTRNAESLADAVALKGMSLVPYTVASAAILKMSEAISRATRDAIKFESEVAKIAQTLNISNKQAAQQTKFIAKMSKDFGLSAPKIAETARVLAQAGGEFENIATLEKTVAALTQSTLLASFEDLTETTDGVIAAMSQFSKEGVNAAKVIGLVNSVSKKYAIEAGDLFEAVRKAGGAFAATGGKMSELFALFTTIRDTTRESAESIAVGLRTITARLQRPATVNFFDKLGISLRKANGEFVGTTEAIKTIQNAIVDKDINPKSAIFAQIVEQLGGVLQQSRVIPLLTERTKLTELLALEEVAEAEAARDAAKQQETLAFKIAQTQQNIAALFREISESDGFKILTDSAIGLTNGLVGLVRIVKDTIPLLALLGGVSLAGSALKRTSGLGLSGGAKLAAYGTGAAAYAFAGGFANGGRVPGSGRGDKIPYVTQEGTAFKAESGEFIIKRSRAEEIGYPLLYALNSGRIDFPGYSGGGKNDEPIYGPNRRTIEEAQAAHTGMFKDSPRAKIAIRAAYDEVNQAKPPKAATSISRIDPQMSISEIEMLNRPVYPKPELKPIPERPRVEPEPDKYVPPNTSPRPFTPAGEIPRLQVGASSIEEIGAVPYERPNTTAKPFTSSGDIPKLRLEEDLVLSGTNVPYSPPTGVQRSADISPAGQIPRVAGIEPLAGTEIPYERPNTNPRTAQVAPQPQQKISAGTALSFEEYAVPESARFKQPPPPPKNIIEEIRAQQAAANPSGTLNSPKSKDALNEAADRRERAMAKRQNQISPQDQIAARRAQRVFPNDLIQDGGTTYDRSPIETDNNIQAKRIRERQRIADAVAEDALRSTSVPETYKLAEQKPITSTRTLAKKPQSVESQLTEIMSGDRSGPDFYQEENARAKRAKADKLIRRQNRISNTDLGFSFEQTPEIPKEEIPQTKPAQTQKKKGFFSRLFSSSPSVEEQLSRNVSSTDPYDDLQTKKARSASVSTTTKATPAVGGIGSGLRSIAGGVGGVGAAALISTSISGLKEWTKALTTSKDGIQSFTGKAIDVGLSFSEIVAPMVAYSAVQKIAEKGLSGFVQSITRLVPKLAPRALLSGARGLATAGLGAAKGGAAAAVPLAAKGLGFGLGGLALFEGVAALSRLVKGKSITEEGGRDESFVRAIKTALDARASAAESKEKTNRIASARGVGFEGDTRLIGDAAQKQLEKFIVKGQDGKIAGLTDEGRRIAIQTNDNKYFDAFIQDLRLSGKDATEFSLALGAVNAEVEKQINLAREGAASQRLMIAAEADAIRSLVGFSFAVKKVSGLSAFGDSASNIASGNFKVNASELGATGDDPRRIASVARQLGATEDAIKSIQSEGDRKSILQDAKVALANSNDPAAFEEFAAKLREIVDSDPTINKDGIASQSMGPEQLLASAESVVEAQSSLKKEMIDSAKNFDQAFNQYIDSISRANEAQLSLNQALLDFGETTRSRAKDREGFSATGTTLSDIRNRRTSIGPVGDGSALRAGLAATSARLTATGMGLNRDPQNAALQQTFAGLQVQQKAQMELLKQDNQLRSQLIDSIKEELALEQGRAKTFQDVNRALSGELGIDAQIQAQETARIANEAQAAVDRGDVSGAQRIISDSSMFGQNPETIKGLLRTSSRETIDLFSQKKGASLFGGGPLQRDAQFSAFGRTEQGSVLDANLVKRNQELGQNDAANIQAMNENVILLRDTANLFTQSISAMGGHMVAFGNEMRNIVASLNNASVKLTMAPANIVVTLNNAEGLAAISKEMKKMVNDAIAQKFLEQQQGM